MDGRGCRGTSCTSPLTFMDRGEARKGRSGSAQKKLSFKIQAKARNLAK